MTEQKQPAKHIGPYRILDTLGEGGMGIVYLAEQTEPIERQVAIKVTRQPRQQSERLHMRFELERRILARMAHPNIARVYEAGDLDDGSPYLVMEYVQGVPLDQYCDQGHLDLDTRLELFLQICAGIHHAHQKGVVHRDIKPANLLVQEQDGQPIVKILDFGIAKDLDTPVDQNLTVGMLMGTPAFASPELAAQGTGGEDGSIDIRSDVYALGVLLYSLVVGQLPHAEVDIGLLEYMERVAHREPALASSRLGQLPVDRQVEVARQRSTTASRLRHRLRGDLDSVLATALARERDQRYGSVTALADDIRRHLAFEPIQAASAGRLYRVRKFVRRHRTAASVAVLILMILVGGLVARDYEARKAHRAQLEAQTVTDFLLGLFADAKPAGSEAEEVTLRQVLDRGTERLDNRFTEEPELRARLLATMGRVHVALGSYDLALDLLLEAEELYQELVPEKPLDQADNLLWLGKAQSKEQHLEDAEVSLRKAVRLHHEHLPADHPRVSESLLQLAQFFQFVHRLDEATAGYKELLELNPETSSDGALMRAKAQTGLGIAYVRLGQVEEGARLLHQGVQGMIASLGPDHLDLARPMNLLAEARFELGEPEEAVRLRRHRLEIEQALLPADHPELASSHTNLGVLLAEMGRVSEAETHFHRAVKIRHSSLGPDHPSLAAGYWNLARAALILHGPREAIVHQEEALRIYRLQPTSSLEQIREALASLVKLHREVGDTEAAKRLERELESLPAEAGDSAEPGIVLIGEAPEWEVGDRD